VLLCGDFAQWCRRCDLTRSFRSLIRPQYSPLLLQVAKVDLAVSASLGAFRALFGALKRTSAGNVDPVGAALRDRVGPCLTGAWHAA
jgi:hypothetical protein